MMLPLLYLDSGIIALIDLVVNPLTGSSIDLLLSGELMQSWVAARWLSSEMASAGVAPSGYKNSSSTSIGAEKLQDQMNELKIRDDKVKIHWYLASGLM
jgi:hypothetical protein